MGSFEKVRQREPLIVSWVYEHNARLCFIFVTQKINHPECGAASRLASCNQGSACRSDYLINFRRGGGTCIIIAGHVYRLPHTRSIIITLSKN